MTNPTALIPTLFFGLFIYFKTQDYSVSIFQTHKLPTQKRVVWAISTYDIKNNIRNLENESIKKELKKSLRNRRLSFYCLFLCFISAMGVGVISNN